VLDLGGNRFSELPAELGDLAELTELRAWRLHCELPESLTRLAKLSTLELTAIQRRGKGSDDPSVPFPSIVPRLHKLRSLDLGLSVLDDIPDALLELRDLEQLDLEKSLGKIARLRDLSRLGKLRVLKFSGSPMHTAHIPGHDLLAAVWNITTLEELAVDRWGKERRYNEETKQFDWIREDLIKLPEDAFARMPGLKVLDLSYDGLTSLPTSFFTLGNLECVKLEGNELAPAVLDRIRAEMPKVTIET
jgi:Leucine-rich repeat (LRR) protein